MKIRLLALMMASTWVDAAPYIVTAPGPNAVKYTPIVVDARKLKTSIADAQKLFPGEEVFVGADRGYPLTSAPVGFSGLWTYDVSGGLFYGIAKSPKVDGFKPTGFSNFIVFPTSLSPNYPVYPHFNKPTSEFGVYLTTTNKAGGVYTDAVTVAVNGVTIATIDLPAFTATYVGIRDDQQPLGTVSFTTTSGGLVSPFVSDGFYLELK